MLFQSIHTTLIKFNFQRSKTYNHKFFQPSRVRSLRSLLPRIGVPLAVAIPSTWAKTSGPSRLLLIMVAFVVQQKPVGILRSMACSAFNCQVREIHTDRWGGRSSSSSSSRRCFEFLIARPKFPSKSTQRWRLANGSGCQAAFRDNLLSVMLLLLLPGGMLPIPICAAHV